VENGSVQLVAQSRAAAREGRPSAGGRRTARCPRRGSLPSPHELAPLKQMSAEPVAAVMVHVSNVEEALGWYQQAFPAAVRCRTEATNFEFLSIGSVQLELVPADEKVSSGPSGSVVYWFVPDLQAALQHLQDVGAKLYRGPMAIEDHLGMCQVQDPWGNCIGLRGPFTMPEVSP